MSLTTVSLTLSTSFICIGGEIKTSDSPAKQWNSEELRLSPEGKELYRLQGVALLIHGELVPDAPIYLTRKLPPTEVQVGKMIPIRGIFKVRAAKGFGLTGTFEGDLASQKGGN